MREHPSSFAPLPFSFPAIHEPTFLFLVLRTHLPFIIFLFLSLSFLFLSFPFPFFSFLFLSFPFRDTPPFVCMAHPHPTTTTPHNTPHVHTGNTAVSRMAGRWPEQSITVQDPEEAEAEAEAEAEEAQRTDATLPSGRHDREHPQHQTTGAISTGCTGYTPELQGQGRLLAGWASYTGWRRTRRKHGSICPLERRQAHTRRHQLPRGSRRKSVV